MARVHLLEDAVAHWPLQDSYEDESANNLDLSVRVAGTAAFDDMSNIRCWKSRMGAGAKGSLNTAGSATPLQRTGDYTWQALAIFRSTSGYQHLWEMDNESVGFPFDAGALVSGVFTVADINVGSGYTFTGATPILDVLCHVTFVRVGSVFRFYMNGILVKTSGAITGAVTWAGDEKMVIGGDITGASLDASLASIRVFNYARSSADILADAEYTLESTSALPIYLRNFDFEADVGTTDGHGVTITSWDVVSGGPATVVKYGSGTFPGISDPGPANRGLNFAGGGKVASSVLHQAVDLDDYEDEVDSGTIRFALSAYMGGCPDQDDNVKIDLVWKTATGGGGSSISTTTLGPALLAERGAINGMILKSTSGAVPSGARSVDVVLTFTRVGGTDNDGYIDNIDLRFSSFEGVQTAEYIKDPAVSTLDVFAYLKITGIPYYFFLRIDPTNSGYGSAAWTLPDGYTSVVKMMPLTGSLDQALPNIIGGIASAERITVDLQDFDVYSPSEDPYSFFGRLLAAPGRFMSNTSAIIGNLVEDLNATDTGAALHVSSLHPGTGDFVADQDVYLGRETIGISTVAAGSGNEQVLTITERNKYPCHPNYPPTPFYRVDKDPDGAARPVTAGFATQYGPFSIIGRSAALYICHITPDEKPEPEANALCRLIGTIKGVSQKDDGLYSIELQSVVGDLVDAKVAPYLASAELRKAIYLPAKVDRTMSYGVLSINSSGNTADAVTKTITIDNLSGNAYRNIDEIARAMNDAFAAENTTVAVGGTTRRIYFTAGINSERMMTIHAVSDQDLSVHNLRLTAWVGSADVAIGRTNASPDIRAGLLYAIGFLSSKVENQSISGTNQEIHIPITGDRPVPQFYIPGNNIEVEIPLVSGPDVNGERFFTNQGDGTGKAYVRFSTGQVGQITASGPTSVTLKGIGRGASFSAPNRGFSIQSDPLYLTESDSLTIQQVLHISPSKLGALGSGDEFFPCVLASKGYDDDGEYNIFPEGVGLGLDGILDKDSFRELPNLIGRGAIEIDVDSSTKFSELWNAYAKERGFFLVWDPETATITCRVIDLPNASAAGDFVFSTSNRSNEEDRSRWQIDMTNIRTSWIMKFGWNGIEKKFTSPEIHINDPVALQSMPATRSETIEDKLVPSSRPETIKAIIENLPGRFWFTRIPWLKVSRTINKTGLLLSPGEYHQIIDPTLVNPFTGTIGITEADGIYAYVFAVSTTLSEGKGKVTLLIDRTTVQSLLRPYSPVGLVDFNATDNGYDDATGIITMDSRYAPSGYDGSGFVVGDKCYLTTLDNSGAPAYALACTVSAVSADGHTVTVDTGLGALSSTVETILILQDWSAQTANRKTGSGRVAFQGDGDNLLIDSTDQLQKWS